MKEVYLVKKLLIGIGVLLLCFPVVLAQSTDYFIQLTPPEFTFRAASGSARINSAQTYSRPSARIELRVSNLRVPEGHLLQGWLRDHASGYWLNLGKFDTSTSGKGSLVFRINHYIDAYDELVITQEKRDGDPRPSTDIKLVGPLVEHYQARAAPTFRQIPRPVAPTAGLGHGQLTYHLS